MLLGVRSGLIMPASTGHFAGNKLQDHSAGIDGGMLLALNPSLLVPASVGKGC